MKLLMVLCCWFWQDPPVDPPQPPAPQDPVASIEVVDSQGQQVVGEVGVGQMLVLKSDKAKHANAEGSLTWIIEPSLQTFSADGGKTVILNTGLKPEVLRIMQIVSSTNGKNTYQRISIRIGQGPQPPPKDDPVVPPKPVDPTDPVVPPAPKLGQLKVLIIEETGSRGELPSDQIGIFTSVPIREYAKKACSKDAKGNPDFLVFDKDVSVEGTAEWVQQAWKQPRQDLPWILLSNGTTGYSGPLPENIDKTLELLKKYGGAE